MNEEAAQPDPPYPKAEPPAVLYHAVEADQVELALREGVHPTGRPHVHLARKAAHARSALRDGGASAIVLQIDAFAMHGAGYLFFASPKSTWLTHHVPARFIAKGE